MTVCTAALALLVSASNAPVKLASPGLTGFNLKQDATQFYSDHFAQQLSLKGIQVITASEIQSLLGLDRQKQLMGCSEQAGSCAAELANALGVDGIITGSIGKFGETYQVNIKILAATNGKPLATLSVTPQGEADLLKELTSAAGLIAPELQTKLGRAPVEVASPGHGWMPYAVGGAGLVLAGVGAGFLAHAQGEHSVLTSPTAPATPVDPAQVRDDERTSQTLGWIGIGVGAAGLAAAALLWTVGSPGATAQVSLRMGPGSVAIAGSFP